MMQIFLIFERLPAWLLLVYYEKLTGFLTTQKWGNILNEKNINNEWSIPGNLCNVEKLQCHLTVRMPISLDCCLDSVYLFYYTFLCIHEA